MTAMIPPVAAAKGAGKAANALTGDLYIKRWQSVQGKGRKKKVVDHELHVNPLTLAIGAGAAAVGAMFLGMGLWMTQKKLKSDSGADMYRVLRIYDAVTEEGKQRDQFAIVMTKRGVPLKRLTVADRNSAGGSWSQAMDRSGNLKAQGYARLDDQDLGKHTDRTGTYQAILYHYHSSTKKKIGIADRTGFLE